MPWYVNLEQPQRRSRLGFDFEDRLLDVFVEPDGRWRWLAPLPEGWDLV
jgi:hypothetical protein